MGRTNAVLLCTILACSAPGCAESVTDGPNAPGDGYAGGARGEPAARLVIPAGAPKVVVLGDSIAAGLHLEASAAFPAVLQRELADDGLPFELINAGTSGDTSAGGLARIGWLLAQEPDLVVVELGGNDALRGIAVPTTEANLRSILERIREAGARALLLGIRVPTSLGKDYSEEFAAIYPRLAEEFEVPYVPYFMQGVGGVPELNLRDGLHPTREGHRRLAETVGPTLASVLRELEPEVAAQPSSTSKPER